MNTMLSQKMKQVKWRELVIYYIFLGVILLFSVLLFDKGFLSGSNLMNIARQTAMTSIMAIGMTFVLSTGEIDLSFGSVVALSAIITAKILNSTGSILLAIVCGLAIGALIGLINGLLVAKMNIPSFLVTLGMNGIVLGLARWVSNLQSIPINNDVFTFIFGSGDIGPLPILFVWTISLTIIGHLLLKKTPYGRRVLATGGNKISAMYSGIKVPNIKISVMLLNSVMAALAGILYSGRLHGARYTLGENDVMIVIAAVIIGGTSMNGGKGSVIGSLLGALIMGILNNGLILMGFSVDQQMIFRGLIIIVSVALTMREKAK
ncbi:ABC transporter permease [uncultured Sphaerochaeta sp.]|uniref:ABC transporter permease n=1 Tax=uncultured Sphaerochaeta sp. TaxID=886478 RepID=UPI0029CA2F35|nr:ABC transporter permease [uncultured Sphaerochaeta sp.]MDC7231138.1 ABC transporter permease [Sphaerochaetaceae bacterium]